jgi:hypothetical protein
MAIQGHWIDKHMRWNEALLAFEPTEGKHSGKELGTLYQQTIRKYGIIHRLAPITTDNASSNTTMIRDINEGLDIALLDQQVIRIPCISHVFQLALGALVASLDCTPTNEQIERTWDSDVVERTLAAQDNGLRARVRRLNRVDKDMRAQQIAPIPMALFKVRKRSGWQIWLALILM